MVMGDDLGCGVPHPRIRTDDACMYVCVMSMHEIAKGIPVYEERGGARVGGSS